jgi:hypothetical protein
MKSIYKIAILFFVIPLLAFADSTEKKHEKSKKIKKTFTVNSDALVSINNRYGNLNITTWDKNTVEIEVTITVKGDDLDDVERKLETINVEFNATRSQVDATTIFGKSKSNWSWWKGGKNINYKVNYIVKMPESNAADLDNDYGNIYLDKLSGEADINCDYGKIDIGELNASNNSINLDYCSRSTIGFIKTGDVNVDYSKITIEDAEEIRVNADYSTVKVNKIESINFNADYGSITLDDVVNVSGNSDYTSMRLGTVRKRLKIDTDYGSLRINTLKKGFESVDITGQYAGIRIGIDTDAVFDFEIDLQYAGFKKDIDNIEVFKSVSKSTKKYYEGKFGKGNTNSRLKIKSQYGSVRFSESN